jgi:hypothetical protein
MIDNWNHWSRYFKDERMWAFPRNRSGGPEVDGLVDKMTKINAAVSSYLVKVRGEKDNVERSESRDEYIRMAHSLRGAQVAPR